MTEQEFKRRTGRFALDVIALVEELPRTTTSQVLGKQLLRCATSVGANYRAACRAQSAADMIAKLAIVEEEADESAYWMELLVASGILAKERTAALLDEANALTAMIVASKKTLRARVDANRKS